MTARARARVVVAVLGAAAGVAVAVAPLASAATTTILTPTAEAWFRPDPACTSQLACAGGALPLGSPTQTAPAVYPAGTLHVGFTAGQEMARSYLAFPLDRLAGAAITSATLTVPLDTATADGSNSPQTSKVQVCLASAPVRPAEGSTDAPPPVDCAASAPAAYVATPSPHLQADLAPLLGGLGQASGLALLPDATKAARTDAWRVVFSAHTRTDVGATPAATLTVAVAAADGQQTTSSATGVTPPATGGVTGGSGTSVASTGTGISGAAAGTGPAPGAVPSSASGSTTSPAATPSTPARASGSRPLATRRFVTVGYAYPAVWALPLVFLVLLPLVARALTRDLVLPRSPGAS